MTFWDDLLTFGGAVTYRHLIPQSLVALNHLVSPFPAWPRDLPLDLRPVCDLPFALSFFNYVRHGYPALQQAWVDTLQRRGQSVPPELIPAFLSLVHAPHLSSPRLIEGLRAILGPRAEWLADVSGHEGWAWILRKQSHAPPDPQTQAGLSLVTQLQAFRRSVPSQARAWLAHLFPHQPLSQKILLLEAMKLDLSMNDEPFLDSLLDDPSPIQEKVIDLLRRLPASRFCQRWRDSLVSLVSFQPHLTLAPLTDLTPALRRDGVRADLSPLERSLQAFSYVPPAFWREAWGLEDSEVVRLLEASPQAFFLLKGWAVAAYYAKDGSAFLACLPALKQRGQKFNYAALRQFLPQALCENYLQGWTSLPLGAKIEAEVWAEALWLCHYPLGPQTAQMILNHLPHLPISPALAIHLAYLWPYENWPQFWRYMRAHFGPDTCQAVYQILAQRAPLLERPLPVTLACVS